MYKKHRIKKAFIKNKWIFGFGILVIAVLLCFFYGNRKIYTGFQTEDCFQDSAAAVTAGVVTDDTMIEQEFFVKDKEIRGVTLLCATYGTEVETGSIHADIRNEAGEILVSAAVDAKNVKDNQTLSIDFGDDRLKAGPEKYTLKLTFQNINKETVSFWISESQPDQGEQMRIGNLERDGHLVMSMVIPENDLFYKYFIGIMVSLMILIFAVYILLYKYKWQLSRIYLCAGCVLGIIYMLVIPVFAAPDEPTHFYMAYDVSNSFLGVYQGKGGIEMRGDDAENEYITSGLSRDYYNQYYSELSKVRVTDDEIVESEHWHLKTYRYFYYISAAGISLVRILKLSMGYLFLSGRLFNMLFFTASVAYAIKQIPFGKTVLFIWALLPVTLQQASSYSYDVIILALTAVVISLTLKIAYEKDAENEMKNWIPLFAGVFLLVPAKSFAMISICFLPFMIWFKKHKINPKVNRYTVALLAGIFVSALLAGIFAPGGGTSLNGGANYIVWAEEEGYTLGELLRNPGHLFEIIGNTIFQKSDYYIGSALGNYLGWSEIGVPMFIWIVYLILLIYAGVRVNTEPVYLGRRMKGYMILAGLLGIAFSFAGMLLTWTPASADIIFGVQGRYFLPFLPVLFLAIRSRNMKMNRLVQQKLLVMAVFLQMPEITAIFMRAV